jgi:23S rRNA-intervening sequence protein
MEEGIVARQRLRCGVPGASDTRYPMKDEGGTGWLSDCSAVCRNGRIKQLARMYAEAATIAPPERCRKGTTMNESKKTYRDLDTWKLAMTLVETTYALTTLLPASERFNLISQISDIGYQAPLY